MKEEELDRPYLWDRSDPVDPEVERLERLLGRFAHRPEQADAPDSAAPDSSEPGPSAGTVERRGPLTLAPLVLAAAAVVLALLWAGGLFDLGSSPVIPPHEEPRVARLSALEVGQWIETSEGEHARLELDGLGSLELEPGTRLRVDEKSGERRLLYLEEGAMEAMVLADPKVFQVDTPAGLTVDLGCFYHLEVADGGVTSIEMILGQVSFEGAGRKIYLPASAIVRAVEDRGPGSPVWGTQGAEVLARVERIEFAAAPDEGEVRELLAELDTLTLWHLLDAASGIVRRNAYDRLITLVPPPSELDAVEILEGDPLARRAQRELWLPRMDWYDTPW